MQLHFIDCIVLDDEKSDALIVISCLEAAPPSLSSPKTSHFSKCQCKEFCWKGDKNVHTPSC